MVNGIKLTQYVFKNDGSDMTIADADDLFGAFLDACIAREFRAGGEVRLVDDEGDILKGGFRNVALSDFPCTLQPLTLPEFEDPRPSPDVLPVNPGVLKSAPLEKLNAYHIYLANGTDFWIQAAAWDEDDKTTFFLNGDGEITASFRCKHLAGVVCRAAQL